MCSGPYLCYASPEHPLGSQAGWITNRFCWPHPGVTLEPGTGECEVIALAL